MRNVAYGCTIMAILPMNSSGKIRLSGDRFLKCPEVIGESRLRLMPNEEIYEHWLEWNAHGMVIGTNFYNSVLDVS